MLNIEGLYLESGLVKMKPLVLMSGLRRNLDPQRNTKGSSEGWFSRLKHLLCICENLSSNHKNSQKKKPDVLASICNPRSPIRQMGGRNRRTHRSSLTSCIYHKNHWLKDIRTDPQNCPLTSTMHVTKAPTFTHEDVCAAVCTHIVCTQ